MVAETSECRIPPSTSAEPAGLSVLVVEDSISEQLRIRTMLSALGYDVVCASDACEALDELRKRFFPLVVTDWQMPNMSGIELCRSIVDDETYGRPYVILVTGRNSKCDLVAGMDAGADDFICKPFGKEELRVRVQAGARIINLREEADRRNIELSSSLQREATVNRLVRRDLDAAAKMQRHLLPSNDVIFDDIETASLFHPAMEIAGDGFNFFRLGERHLVFYHIDVAGHGVAAAMLSFTVSHFLSPETGGIVLNNHGHASSEEIVAPHDVVAALNQRFQEFDDNGHYFTIVYGAIDLTTGYGRLCQAGHPAPLIADSKGDVRSVGAGGFPVGMLPDATYTTVDFNLAANERLFLYSDGVTEALGSDGKPFSLDRLSALISATAQQPLASAICHLDDELSRWRGTRIPEDDISVLAISRNDARS